MVANKKKVNFENLPEYLKAHREDLGLSLRDMSKKFSISHTTLRQFETGEAKALRIETLTRIAQVLNIEVIIS